jgi:UDP-N-acetylmuramate dehydrogenase
LKIYKDISLKAYNTFSLDYMASRYIIIENEQEAVSLFSDPNTTYDPFLILGSGSNILFTSDFNGTVLHSEINGIRIEVETPEYIIISAGSGVNWDHFVEWCVNKGYGGLENLSLIPGTVGASPVQNIGAYGVEVKDSVEKVRAVSTLDGSIKEFSRHDCRFGYRNSIFKSDEKGKFIVTKVYFKLNSNPLFHLKYGLLAEEVAKLGKTTLKNIRQAIINIRRSKLPDPAIIGNAGSFFKNPVVDNSEAERLKKNFPDVPTFDVQPGSVKLAAGWLIDQCGWKGKRIGNAGVYEKQALILVNHGKATGKEIYCLSEEIKNSVKEKFGIVLEREIELVGSI